MMPPPPNLDLALLLKARRVLDAAPVPEGLQIHPANIAESMRAFDLVFLARFDWLARWSLSSNNPFR